jgi:cytochrome b561
MIQKYTLATRLVHWVSALLIIGLFILGKYLTGLEGDEKLQFVPVHASLGFLLFLITLYRVFLFFKTPKPDEVDTGSKFNNTLVKVIHNGFYILLLLISTSGITTMVLGGYPDALDNANAAHIIDKSLLPQLNAHEILANITMLLVVVHVAGVIKHYMFKKENTLKRII